MTLGQDMVFTLFTSVPELAAEADKAGVNRIGLDLETIGKIERQDPGKNWVSDHTFDQLDAVKSKLKHAELFVRTNPIHSDLKQEVDSYIDAGVQTVMLPMVKSAEDAKTILDIVDGRAKVSLLVETPAGATRLHEIIKLKGIDDIHIGLNDMHLGLGLASHFEVLASELMELWSKMVRDAGISFGFGGVGRLNDDRLPISSDMIYAQYARLHGTRALVSRVFTNGIPVEQMTEEIAKCRAALTSWGNKSSAEIESAKNDLRAEAIRVRRAKLGLD